VKGETLDRLAVVWIAGALTVWAACLVLAWAWAFAASGLSTLLSEAAVLLAAGLAALLPGRAARAFQRLLIWLGVQDVAAMELAMAAPPVRRRTDARAAVAMMGAAALFATACGAASTAAVWLGADLFDWLARRAVWTPPAWAAVRLVVQVVGLLPMALGVSVAFLVAAVVRGGGGGFAGVWREWLWGVSAGLAAFGAAWWAGADLLGVAVVAGVATLAASAALFLRRGREGGGGRPRRRIEDRPGARARLTVLGAYAVLALIAAVQARLLTDVLGADLGACAFWAAGSLALLAALLAPADRRSSPPGRAQGAAAVLGVAAAATLQVVLVLHGFAAAERSPGEADFCLALALLAQVPLAGCGAIALSRQRRLFTGRGGRARWYVSLSAGGAGVGLLAYVAIGWWGLWVPALLGGAMSLVAGAGVAAIAAVSRPADQVRWAACAGVLIGALAAAAALAVAQADDARGPVRAGVWLTAESAGSRPPPAGLLPARPAAPGEAVTRAAADVIARRPGKWWFVAPPSAELAALLPPGVVAASSSPDPTASAAPRPAEGLGGILLRRPGFGYFRPPSAGQGRCDGVFLAPMPADAPQAWRCYGASVLRNAAARGRLSRGAAAGAPATVILLRTCASGGRLGAAIAVARTYLEAIGSGWVVARVDEAGVDLLIVGPAGAVGPPAAPEGASVLRLAALCRHFPGISPIRVMRPRAAWQDGSVAVTRLLEVLRARRERPPGGRSAGVIHGASGAPARVPPAWRMFR
jgi:hypothetical protein